MKALSMKEKYHYYEAAVQNPSFEVETMEKLYFEIRNKEPISLREDFCGSGAITSLWGRREGKVAWGVDLDPEPLEEGKKRHYHHLSDKQKKGVHYSCADVLTFNERTDIVCAFNFSYFIFHERAKLLHYFKTVHKSLNKDGLFMLDIFGGPESMVELEEKQARDGFTYYWDCQSFNPLTHLCRYAIHIKPKGKAKHKDLFVYNWRFWSVPEVVDLLKEAGFSDVKTYWEEDDEEDETGSGVFYETQEAENCEAWVTYIIGVK